MERNAVSAQWWGQILVSRVHVRSCASPAEPSGLGGEEMEMWERERRTNNIQFKALFIIQLYNALVRRDL